MGVVTADCSSKGGQTKHLPQRSQSPVPVTLGWRGVSLRVPEEWTLTKVSGDGPNGYLRADNLDGYFVQVKWTHKKGLVSVPDAFDTYVRDLQKTAKKQRQTIDVRTKPRSLSGVHRSEDAPLTYSWISEQKALGVIYHCGECKRLVIAEVVGPPDGDFSMAAPILASLREHGEKGWNTWGVHGLLATIPAEFQLEKQMLVTGHVMLRFRHRSRLLILQQWGLANVALRGTDVAEWFEYQERNRLGRYSYRRDRSPFRGHQAYRLSGRDRLLPALVKSSQQLTALTRPALGFSALAWHCEEANRIYAVMAEHSRGDTVFEDVLERLPCHGEVAVEEPQTRRDPRGRKKGR